MESDRFLGQNFGFDQKKESVSTVTTVDNHRIVLTDPSDESEEEEKQDQSKVLYGHEARTQFWHLYKSERKFKDFDTRSDWSKDPRFAYFQECNNANILPRSRQIIKETETTCLDYTN